MIFGQRTLRFTVLGDFSDDNSVSFLSCLPSLTTSNPPSSRSKQKTMNPDSSETGGWGQLKRRCWDADVVGETLLLLRWRWWWRVPGGLRLSFLSDLFFLVLFIFLLILLNVRLLLFVVFPLLLTPSSSTSDTYI